MGALAGCPYNVKQDKATGEDGSSKNAVEMVMENGEAKAVGIVTYPGGDRADWKVVELPEKVKGTMEVRLTWTAPRPGLQLNLDVFDEWGTPLITSSKQKKKRKKSRSRSEVFENAKGKYFIRVFADGRGDAGKYKLAVNFAEVLTERIPGVLEIEVPPPPRLPDLPEILQPCLAHDPNNPSCMTICAPGAPPDHPPCIGKCPTPPTIDVEACWKTMPCPTPPDIRVKKCTPITKFWPPCPDPRAPDPDNPRCLGVTVPPVVGRIVNKKIQGSDMIITIGVGTAQGVTDTWRAVVLQGAGGKLTDPPLSGGEAVIIRVDKLITTAKVNLTADQIQKNPFVRLKAP